MKFPVLLIPRTVYDDMRMDAQRQQEKIDELQRILLDLKLDGAQIVARDPEYARRIREIKNDGPDLIDEAIQAHPKCKRNKPLAREWRKWADARLAGEGGKKMTKEEIVLRIRSWDVVKNAGSDDEDEEDRQLGLVAS